MKHSSKTDWRELELELETAKKAKVRVSEQN